MRNALAQAFPRKPLNTWLLVPVGGFALLALFGPFPSTAVLGLAALVAVGGLAALFLHVDLSLGLVAWLLVFPFYRGWSFLQFPGMPNIGPDRLIWLAMLGIVFVSWALRRDEGFRPGAVEGAMLIFLAVTIYSMARVGAFSDRDAVGDFLGRHFIPLTLFVVARFLTREESQVRRLLVAASLMALYLGFTAICENYKLNAFVFPRYIMNPNIGTHFGRARGPLLQAAANGTLLGMLFLLNVYAALHAKGAVRGLFALAAGLAVVGIYFTYTRAAYLGLLAGTAFYFVRSAKARKILLISTPLVVLLAVVVAPVLVGHYEQARSDNTLPVLDRINLWATALNMFVHSPVWGHGFYTFPVLSPRYFVEVIKLPRFWVGHGTPSHNSLLEILSDEGLVGFVPYVAIFVLLVLAFRRVRWSGKWLDADVVPLFWALTAVLWVNSFFIVQNRVIIFGLYFLFCGALLGVGTRLDAREGDATSSWRPKLQGETR